MKALSWKKPTYGRQESSCGLFRVHRIGEPQDRDARVQWMVYTKFDDFPYTEQPFRTRGAAKDYCQKIVNDGTYRCPECQCHYGEFHKPGCKAEVAKP